MNAIDRYDSNTYTITVDVFDSYPLYISKADDEVGTFTSIYQEHLHRSNATGEYFLDRHGTDVYCCIEATWNICNAETGTPAMVSTKRILTLLAQWLVGQLNSASRLSLFQVNSLDRPVQCTKITVSITAVDTNGDDYKGVTSVKWDILEELFLQRWTMRC